MSAPTHDALPLRVRGVLHSLRRAVRRPETRTRVVAGITADLPTPDARTDWTVWRHGGDLAGERAVIGDALRHTRPDDVVWDVGADMGIYSAFFGQAAAAVVPFEPAADRAAILRETLTLNGIDARLQPVALGDLDGAGVWLDGGVHPATQGDTSVRRADSLLDELPAPDVVKLDVEGAEAPALEGFGDALDGVRVLYVEPHDTGLDEDALADRLRGTGYRVATVACDCDKPILRGVRS